MRFLLMVLVWSSVFLGCSVVSGADAGGSGPCSCDHASPEHSAEGRTYNALPGLAHGLIQSPVNILTLEAEDGSHAVELLAKQRGTESIVNKGHTIELGFPRGISISLDGVSYAVVQTHFHTPSEHRIDGMTYPMEMHVVSMAPPEAPDAPPEYLVVSMLFRMGRESPFIERVLATVPSVVGEEHSSEPLFMTDLFEGDLGEMREQLQSFFHYRGSLTTPPYSETVEWLVLKRIFEASPRQIESISAIEGDNARRIQMLFGRPVDQ